jgi:hypothetical protein
MSIDRSNYTADIADIVLSELAAGRALADICRDEGMPAARTVRLWVMEDREGFAARYARARQIGRHGSGRVSIYSPELAERILEQLSEGRLLIDICNDPGMPAARTVRDWAMVDREGFAARYDRARELGCHAMSEQMVAIADDGRNDWIIRYRKDGTAELMIDHEHISRSQLRVTTRQWMLVRMLPRQYGNQPEGIKESEDLMRRAEAKAWGTLLKAVDGKTRGLPNKCSRILSTPEQAAGDIEQTPTKSDKE